MTKKADKAAPAPELGLTTLIVAYEVIRQVPAGNAQQAVKVANALVELEAYIAKVYPQAIAKSEPAANAPDA